MLSLADQAEKDLVNSRDDLNKFGWLLNYRWKLKRQTGAKVSADDIDVLYDEAITAETLGGKLLDADGGGFLVFYVKPEKQTAVCQVMQNSTYVRSDLRVGDTRGIHYSPETYTP